MLFSLTITFPLKMVSVHFDNSSSNKMYGFCMEPSGFCISAITAFHLAKILYVGSNLPFS